MEIVEGKLLFLLWVLFVGKALKKVVYADESGTCTMNFPLFSFIFRVWAGSRAEVVKE